MSEYRIMEKVVCEHCHGEPQYENILGSPPIKVRRPCISCQDRGFHLMATLDADEWLLSRLAKLRWNEAVRDNITREKLMENPRFDGMEIVNE